MLFNSLIFPIFLVCVFSLYLSLSHRAQNRMLLAASLLFYAVWDWRFLGLLYFSVVLDFWCGLRIAQSETREQRRLFLVLSLCGNLGVLGFFKYFNFFRESFAHLFSRFGVYMDSDPWNIILPLGVSFYTFQSMSYTIDLYRGEIQPVRRFQDFALYVTFFPQLVAGPIERASTLLPQLLSPRIVAWSNIRAGVYLMLTGFFKKMVIADNLAPIVEQVFDTPYTADHAGVNVLVGMYCFAFQIYGDFAGYTDIARGVAKLFGIDLILNFQRPYFAANPAEFWRRWHISLSTWLRDYLYIPLGGNRHGPGWTYRNLVLTMVLGGFWHGANGTFVAWGFLWGAVLALHRFFSTAFESWTFGGRFGRLAVRVVSSLLTFHIWCVSMMIFRARSMDDFWTLLARMLSDFDVKYLSYPALTPILYFVPVYMAFELAEEIMAKGKTQEPLTPWWWKSGKAAFMLAMLISHGAISGARFIYFQF
jgi:D-alanyl-lipoteichoic acid acyltransferase DltB (MBOAT superfamily)